jgi:hypothetical protein
VQPPLTGAIALLVSLGPTISFGQHRIGAFGPWQLVAHLPIFDMVLPTRLTFVTAWSIAILLSLGAQRVLDWAPAPIAWRAWGLGALAVALLPLMPLPVGVAARPPVPEFFAGGMWRHYVPTGGTIVSAVPFDNANAEPFRWQVAAGMGFSTVEGYFVGPVGEDGHGWYTPDPEPVSQLFTMALRGGRPLVVQGEAREDVLRNLRYWKADAIVLAVPHMALKSTIDGLIGSPGQRMGGVWVWDVHTFRGEVRYSP